MKKLYVEKLTKSFAGAVGITAGAVAMTGLEQIHPGDGDIKKHLQNLGGATLVGALTTHAVKQVTNDTLVKTVNVIKNNLPEIEFVND